jgi:hypothetical protein
MADKEVEITRFVRHRIELVGKISKNDHEEIMWTSQRRPLDDEPSRHARELGMTYASNV